MAQRLSTTVTLSQIAELAGVHSPAVSNWRKRFDDFPRPVETSTAGHDLFQLAQVEEWLREHDRFGSEQTIARRLFEVMDLLRDRARSDEAVQIFAAAIALTEAVDRAGGSAPDGSVNELIQTVEETNASLDGVFASLESLDVSTADQIVAGAREIKPADRVAAFEQVLDRRSRFLETRTAYELTHLIANLAKSAGSLLDPSAGEGGTLLAAGQVRKHQAQLFGQEINGSAWRTAKQRFLLHDLDVDLRLGDSLSDDLFPNQLVDAVLCDPPYAMKLPAGWSDPTMPHRENFGAIKARSADFVWLEHAISHLSDGGRGYIVLPAATLFRRGSEHDIRAELIRRGAVEAVITLPPGSARHTTVPLALWIIQRPGKTAEWPVLLVDPVGDRVQPNSRVLDADMTAQVAEIVNEWRANQIIKQQHCDVATAVSALELLGSDSNLTPTRWLTPRSSIQSDDPEREVADAADRFTRARNRLEHAASGLASLQVPERTQWIAVRDLVDGNRASVVRGVRVRPAECLPQGTRVLRTRDVQNAIVDDKPCYVVPENMKPRPTLTEPGDIVLSPASGKLRALVDEAGGHVLALPVQALRLQSDWLDPYVAAAFLESPRNRRFARGVTWGYARVDLRDLELPLLDLHEAQRVREQLKGLAAAEQAAWDISLAVQRLRTAIVDPSQHDDA